MEIQDIYEELNWKEIEMQLEQLYPEWELSFSKIVETVLQGNAEGIFQVLAETLKNNFSMEFQQIKEIAVLITSVIFISAIFVTFKDAFKNHQIAEISFYVNYLILTMLFMNIFSETLQTGEETLRKIESFMRIFFPAFALLIGTGIGAGSGLLYYNLSGIVIYLVEKCLLTLLLPGISLFMLFVIMNGIWEEEKLDLLLKFIRKSLKFILKFLLGILTGSSVMQSMIIPVMERMKGEGINKIVEAIPGIGTMASGMLKIWLGSVVVIKNSIGIAGCLFLCLVTLAPLVRIFIMGTLLKLLAALLSIAGDKKMINCTNQVGDGIFLVLQTVSSGILFFVVLITAAAFTLNGGI